MERLKNFKGIRSLSFTWARFSNTVQSYCLYGNVGSDAPAPRSVAGHPSGGLTPAGGALDATDVKILSLLPSHLPGYAVIVVAMAALERVGFSPHNLYDEGRAFLPHAHQKGLSPHITLTPEGWRWVLWRPLCGSILFLEK